MYPSDQRHYQLNPLDPRVPTRMPISRARRKTFLWIAALLLELCVTLSVCGTTVIVVVSGGRARALASLLGTGLAADISAEEASLAEDLSPVPTVRVPVTSSPTRAATLQPGPSATATRTATRPIGRTGSSSPRPNASPTRAPTYTPIPAGKVQVKVATPTITRTPTRTPTATATRIPPTPYPTDGPPPPPGTCILGCR